MKISTGVYMLEIPFGENSKINPVLIESDGRLTLVDTGYPGQYDLIKAAIEAEGFSINSIDFIVLTHQDLDHIGCTKEIKTAVPSSKILAHEEEIPYIEAAIPPYKLRDKLATYDSLSEEEQKNIDERVKNAKKYAVKVDKSLKDGDILDCGAKVILTNGHTSGHISLYLPKQKTLVTGDALIAQNGKLVGPSPIHTYDYDKALQSLKNLKEYDIQTLLVYHGGRVDSNLENFY